MSGPPARLGDAQRADHQKLIWAVDDLDQSGARIPCRGPNWQAWTSDDPEHQEFAAAHCGGCAALRSCRQYIDTYPGEDGVYAGLTPADRSPRRGRPKKGPKE